MATTPTLSFSPAEKLSARSPRDGPRSARLQSRTPAKDKPGRQWTDRLAKPTEPQAALPAAATSEPTEAEMSAQAATSEPTEAEMSAQAAEANAQAAEVSRHEEEVLTAAR